MVCNCVGCLTATLELVTRERDEAIDRALGLAEIVARDRAMHVAALEAERRLAREARAGHEAAIMKAYSALVEARNAICGY